MTNTVILPDNYKPSEDEEYMNNMQLEYFKQKLLNWKKDIINESNNTLEHLKEDTQCEVDLNYLASIESERNFELKTSNRYLKLIKKIDVALTKIDNSTYGYCEETGEQIGIKRLMARPVATLCITAQEQHEANEKIGR